MTRRTFLAQSALGSAATLIAPAATNTAATNTPPTADAAPPATSAGTNSPAPAPAPDPHPPAAAEELFSGRPYPPANQHPAIRAAMKPRRVRDPRPNILFIFTDQQWAGALGCAGNRWAVTPHQDRLAARGTRFQHASCTAPICTPSRASLMTGLMPHATGADYLNRPLAGDIPTMGQIFEQAGYETTYVGKWHLPESFPLDRDAIPGCVNLALPASLKPTPLGDQTDAFFARMAGNYLRWHAGLTDKPWLLTVSLHNPHDICYFCVQPPLDHPHAAHYPPLPPNHDISDDEPEFLAWRRAQADYAREMPATRDWSPTQWRAYLQAYYHWNQAADLCVGEILNGLHEGGWDDSTLIVFSSDHGEGMAAHRWVTKLSFYEESMAVPLFLSWPGRIPAGRVDSATITNGADLLPTLCDFAGIDNPPAFHGRSLRPVLEDPDASGPDFAVGELALHPKKPDLHGRMIRTRGWKYCVYSAGERPEQLFDLSDDPGETRNLAFDPDHQKTRTQLRSQLAAWLKQTNDPFALPA